MNALHSKALSSIHGFLNSLTKRCYSTALQDISSLSSLQISNFLKSNHDWTALTKTFGSAPLTQPIVESVLFDLKEPVFAKKALTFFHWSASNSNASPFLHGPRSYCLTVHILVRAGLLSDARALIQSAIKKEFPLVETIWETYASIVPGSRVFDLLIQTYVKLSMVEPAFDACKFFTERGFSSNLITFNAILSKAVKSDKFDFAWKVFEYMFERRIYPNKSSYEIMVDLLCKEGSLNNIINIVEKIQGKKGDPPNVYINVALILKIFEENRIEQGILLLKRMSQKNMIFDNIYHSLLILAYCNNENISLACVQCEDMIKKGGKKNAFIYTCFIGAFCKNGDMNESINLLHEMISNGLKPYDKTCNYIIEGFCLKKGREFEALDFCEKMLKDGFLPDKLTCSSLFDAIGSIGEVKKANDLLTRLLYKGFKPTLEVYIKLINGYGSIGDFEGVIRFYYEMEFRGIVVNLEVFNSLIRNLCLCGDLNEAEKFMVIARKKGFNLSDFLFDLLIRGFLEKGEKKRAIYWYDEMEKIGLVPSGDTFMKLVKDVIVKKNIN
ncbi:hypothetical protein LUZ60_007407 [Juncus effusus]|nr:hypothetical protein LUZ60_007407 [Juncus effusus]